MAASQTKMEWWPQYTQIFNNELDQIGKNSLLRQKRIEVSQHSAASENLKQFFKDLSPYIVVGSMFLLLFLYCFGYIGSNKKNKNKNKNNRKIFPTIGGPFTKLFKVIRDFIQTIFTPSHQIRLMTRMFKFGGASVDTKPRDRLKVGRCDNIRWADKEGEGRPGHCETTSRPEDIHWELDIMQFPEYFDLPVSIKNEFSNKLNVIIPYSLKPEASFYVPMCEKAVYADTCDRNDPHNLSKCQKAHLFEDNGLSCKLREQSSLRYPIGKRCVNSNSVDIMPIASMPKRGKLLADLNKKINKKNIKKTISNIAHKIRHKH
jgi:hypothetical protein